MTPIYSQEAADIGSLDLKINSSLVIDIFNKSMLDLICAYSYMININRCKDGEHHL